MYWVLLFASLPQGAETKTPLLQPGSYVWEELKIYYKPWLKGKRFQMPLPIPEVI